MSLRRPLDPESNETGRGLHGPGRGNTGADDGTRGGYQSPDPSVSFETAVSLAWGRHKVPGRVMWASLQEAHIKFDVINVAAGPATWRRVEGSTVYAVYAICEAPVAAVHAVWRDGVRFEPDDFSRLVGEGGAIEWALSETSAAWPDMPAGTSEDMAWRGLATFRAKRLAMPDGRVPALEFEVSGIGAPGTGASAPAISVIRDLLTTPRLGFAGLPSASVITDVGADNSAASSAERYCEAEGWQLAYGLSDPRPVDELLGLACQAANLAPLKVEGGIKLIPLSCRPKGSYAPPSSAPVLDDDEILGPVRVETIPHTKVKNRWPIQITSRPSQYMSMPYAWRLDSHAIQYGTLTAKVQDNPFIATPEHALKISQLLALRSVYSRNRYRLELGPRWGLLEPGDVCAVRHSTLGIDARARISSIDRREDGRLELVLAEEPDSIAAPVDLTPQTHDGMSAVVIAPTYANERALDDLSNVAPETIAEVVGGATSDGTASITWNIEVSPDLREWSAGGAMSLTRSASATVTLSLDAAYFSEGGAGLSTICTLPSGYRPSATRKATGLRGSTPVTVSVASNGVVSVSPGPASGAGTDELTALVAYPAA